MSVQRRLCAERQDGHVMCWEAMRKQLMGSLAAALIFLPRTHPTHSPTHPPSHC